MNKEKLKRDLETVKNEYGVCKQKLDSKCEALLILSKDLDCCRQERDQFKLMAEQVQQRYQALKRQLAGVGPRVPSSASDLSDYSGMKSQNLAQLLSEMRECNKSLQFDADDLRQKLKDANGDIKLLREQIARQRVGTTDEGMNTRHFPAHEREDLVQQLEDARQQMAQLERDLQQVLDEKEDQETERDVYRDKYERLNEELNYMLKGDERRIVDIDALVTENRYLQDRLNQMSEEKGIAMATVSKYKNLLERKKNKGILKLGQTRAGGVVISQRQVKEMLHGKGAGSPTPQMLADLQSLASGLLETVNDKNLALQHQRKTNKILGNRVSELEKKLKTLEVSGLWSMSGKSSNLDKLKLECEEIKTLIPRKFSEDSSDNHRDDSRDSEGALSPSSETPESSPAETTPTHSGHRQQTGQLSLEDLDFLPTKETTGIADSPGVMSPASVNDLDSVTSDLDIEPSESTAELQEQSPEHELGNVNMSEADVSAFEDFIATEDSNSTQCYHDNGEVSYEATASELNSLMEEMTLKVTQQKPGTVANSSTLQCELAEEGGETVAVCSGESTSASEVAGQLTDKSPLLVTEQESEGDHHSAVSGQNSQA